MSSYRFTVYDPNIHEIMKKLRKKRGVFIEVAVREFLKTEKGKSFLQVLLDVDLTEKEEKKRVKITFDDFL